MVEGNETSNFGGREGMRKEEGMKLRSEWGM